MKRTNNNEFFEEQKNKNSPRIPAKNETAENAAPHHKNMERVHCEKKKNTYYMYKLVYMSPFYQILNVPDTKNVYQLVSKCH